MFAIEIDPECKLITIRLSGLLTVEEVERLLHQEQSAVVALGYRSGEYLLLVDASGCVIQSQEVIAAFQAAVAATRLSAARVAVVRGPSLTLLQTQRILRVRENAQIAATEVEARAWLMRADSFSRSAPVSSAPSALPGAPARAPATQRHS
ncbi:hypothetical protein [Sphingomonas asaccharolytica]|uniref:hypothetical protein n=1 Tax=Sphingomonas asaccharolytica TaxID=40681 RepID=UPI0012EDA3E0|nr:hypothetical protein [Sphingomonas asaccharolytica]